MIAVRRFLALFRNSPTYGRDQASLISGFNIGLAALVLNGAILLTLLPLMMDPNDPDFRKLTENIEFGQLLGLILLGGATAFATLLIPMRLGGVFMGPRIGRYFDQIVLSGITPLRFLIGKVTSQNLFMALMLFLLLPWFVLVLALGGLQWPVFLANLFLLWLYCMMMALVMLWLTLYVNEVLAMFIVLFCGAWMCGLGCAPIPYQPFVFSPFPALMHSVYAAAEALPDEYSRSYLSTFVSCATGMSCVIAVSLVAISMGPLYGIIRDNSTFGEVVRAGDSKRKRRFRLRLHIQRPSELAFFYENRGDTWRRCEGLLRWGIGFLGLLVTTGAAWTFFIVVIQRVVVQNLSAGRAYISSWFYAEFTTTCHVFHGITLVLAIMLFSHSRNTTYLRVPFVFGWKAEVSKLDSICFVIVLLLSSGVAIGFPFWFEANVLRSIPTPSAAEVAASGYQAQTTRLNFVAVAWKGILVLNLAAVAAYLMQRLICLSMWMKSVSMMLVAVLYGGMVCLIPIVLSISMRSVYELQQYQVLFNNAPRLIMVSPAMILLDLYGERPPNFPQDMSSLPFYVVHSVLILSCLFAIRMVGRKLRLEYLTASTKENR